MTGLADVDGFPTTDQDEIKSRGQWPIQDFPEEGGANPRGQKVAWKYKDLNQRQWGWGPGRNLR